MHCALTPSVLSELSEIMDMAIKALIVSHCSTNLNAVLLTSKGLIKCNVKNSYFLLVQDDGDLMSLIFLTF